MTGVNHGGSCLCTLNGFEAHHQWNRGSATLEWWKEKDHDWIAKVSKGAKFSKDAKTQAEVASFLSKYYHGHQPAVKSLWDRPSGDNVRSPWMVEFSVFLSLGPTKCLINWYIKDEAKTSTHEGKVVWTAAAKYNQESAQKGMRPEHQKNLHRRRFIEFDATHLQRWRVPITSTFRLLLLL